MKDDQQQPSSVIPSSTAVPAGLEADPRVKPVAGASAGVLAGAAVGAFAGPIGAVTGAVAGALAGAVAGAALEKEDAMQAEEERKLDDAIGVTAGTLGAGPGAIASTPTAPARGAFSAASSGVAGVTPDDEGAPAEGGIPKAE